MSVPEAKKPKVSLTQLDQLKKHTIVVADTGDIESIKQFSPTDATTNPSLILKAATQKQYEHLLTDAVNFAKEHVDNWRISKSTYDLDRPYEVTPEKELLDLAIDKICVNFGTEILKLVEGVVSTEVDARLSFNVEGSVARARRIIKLYEANNVNKNRVLIKLASTWEGFQAATILAREDIKCNMTLLFSFYQAVLAAQLGVELISPFVGRILDWNKSKEETSEEIKNGWINTPSSDPGVLSVTRIFNYYKKHGYNTIIMGASFRNKGEILELTGCDKLTIGPNFLEELKQSDENVAVKLTVDGAKNDTTDNEKIELDESSFRWFLNEDAMATEKLAEGIRKFAVDIIKLEKIVQERLA